MKTYQELKKACKRDPSDFPIVKLAILGDCATQLLSTAIKGSGIEAGLNLQVLDTDYNQIRRQVIDSNSELYCFAPEYILIQMCTEKLYERYCDTPMQRREQFSEDVVDEIRQIWKQITANSGARILQYNFVLMCDAVFGNYGTKVKDSFRYQLQKLNLLLMDLAAETQNAFILDLASIQTAMGNRLFFDEKYYYSAKTPLSLAALPYAAKAVLDTILALRGKLKKCVILDLDNTLWGGVIGDDGMAKIQIGELGTGHAFTDVQLWLRELRRRGIILAVCSKNNKDTAKEPFEKHPDMILRLEDISIFVANWEDKVSNIRYIQQTLNLGMDSMVFIDDNPFERNMVNALIPDITVPELPQDPAQYLRYLQNLNLFETASYSEEDQQRTKQYQAEINRSNMQQQFNCIDDYLESLEMNAQVHNFDEFHCPRIAQLTQRSNQFNLRTVRYTEEDIQRIANDPNYMTAYFTLKDKFGDYGLISVVIFEKRDGDTLFIDTWLMSCRVLKRGMEEFIVDRMMQIARNNGYKKVVGEYLKTPKNAMVEDIYEKMGFVRLDKNHFVGSTDLYQDHKTHIKEELA